MAILDRAAILAADDLPTETVDVPEWGGEVIMRGLTASERDEFEAESITLKKGRTDEYNLRDLRARLVSRCAVDAEGKRLFTKADVEALGQKNATVLTRLFLVAQRLSGFGAGDVEELAKNSESVPPASSASS